MVAPADRPGEEPFDVDVCTPRWLEARAAEHGPIVGRHYPTVVSFPVRPGWSCLGGVGNGYKVASDGRTLISRDGLRQYRPPSYKLLLDRWQANFEERVVPSGEWQSNGHLDIWDLP